MPRAMLWGLILLVILGLGLPACGVISQFDPRPRDEAKEYIQTIEPYLVEGEVYHGPATRLLFLSNPNNPTGAVYDRELLEAIAATARAAKPTREITICSRFVNAVNKG